MFAVMGTWLWRLMMCVAIAVDGVLWFVSIECIIAGLWLSAPDLRSLGQAVVATMVVVHLALGVWPMRWGHRLIERRWPMAAVLLVLLAGCAPKEDPLPPVPPPLEDLSTWTVPELVQPERHKRMSLITASAKVPAGAAEKVYDYKPGVAVEVPVAIGHPLDILLEPGEQVRQIVDGDRAPVEQGQARRWEVKEGAEGSGEELRPHIFVTVTEPGLTNGLTITTTRRRYYITCKSVMKSPTRVLRWHYPQDSQERAPVEEAPGLLPHPEQPMRYHVGYEITTSQPTPAFVPRHVVDDGKKLYIVYPEVTLFDSVPMLRLLGPNGPQLVNSRQYLNVVIVDQLVARAELRVGIGERAETVTITRGTLRTITCPGDEACPVWSRAAAVLAGRTP